MVRLILAVWVCLCAGQSFGQLNCEEFERAMASGEAAWVEYVGGDQVEIRYRGDGTEMHVALVSDLETTSYHSPYWDKQGRPMVEICPQYHLFAITISLPLDARIEYKFNVDGEFIVDPRNPRTVASGVAPPSQGEEVATASELRMPGYSFPHLARSEIRGQLHGVNETWAKQKITVYTPPGFTPNRRYPVMYTADGSAWLEYYETPQWADQLILSGEVEPLIIVFIDPRRDRGDWYAIQGDYLAYLRKVVAWVDQNYPTQAAPEARLHAGTSAGGRASLSVLLEAPDLLLNTALLSPSIASRSGAEFIAKAEIHPEAKVWLSAGSFEQYIYDEAKILEAYFRRSGTEVSASYSQEGHSLAGWRNQVPRMLKYFFAAESLAQ